MTEKDLMLPTAPTPTTTPGKPRRNTADLTIEKGSVWPRHLAVV